jgi:hypothetical protein
VKTGNLFYLSLFCYNVLNFTTLAFENIDTHVWLRVTSQLLKSYRFSYTPMFSNYKFELIFCNEDFNDPNTCGHHRSDGPSTCTAFAYGRSRHHLLRTHFQDMDVCIDLTRLSVDARTTPLPYARPTSRTRHRDLAVPRHGNSTSSMR